MAKQRFLKHAPLREAVIDLRTVLPADFNPANFEELIPQLAGDYPIHELQYAVHSEVHLGADSSVAQSVKNTPFGSLFRSADQFQVVQFRVDGFTFSRLSQYTDWDKVFPEAMRLWRKYVDVAHPTKITRMASRYINDMRFPWSAKISDLLTAPPPVPPGVAEEVVAFLTRVTLRDSETATQINITQALGDAVDDDHMSIILDIDAYQIVELEDTGNTDLLSEHFETLRRFKNLAFFESITEEAARRFA